MTDTDMQQDVLRIERLTVSLKQTGAATVRDISFSIKAGETLCVVGESGSGKSVTSLAVMGLLDPAALAVTAGRIVVDGTDVLAASREDLQKMRATRMSMVFQEPMTALNPVETVGAQVEEVLRVHGETDRTKRRKRVLEMFEAVHLPEPERIYTSYPHQLSGGQRQRIVISMALIMRPKLLIADEPTTALDVTTQRQILLLIGELQKRYGTAVLFITHDFGVVSEIADRIVVMNRGDMVEIGSRDAVLANPKQDYTRMLVASVPSLSPPERTSLAGSEVLRVTGLTKVYASGGFFFGKRQVDALKPTDLDLRRGEIFGVVGESGSGKTTFARCLTRLIQPSAGSILLDGTDISQMRARALRPHRRRLQVVFQDPFRSLNARMRVRDVIVEGMLNFGAPKDEAYERAGVLMERVGLSRDMLGRFPHQFSGGQRQRISIARALALEPDILVADESVSALDVSVQKQVLELLRGICDDNGVGILFITHDLRVAAQICDRIAVMRKGEVVEAGTAHAVLSNPSHAYTRDLIAAAPGRHWDFANFKAYGPPA
ncbi:ABC transporter ATP-binding protein (plasmid) [Agrobacterium tumefaciens]|nr:ABC transporter ATP-binding protein [Agrobacterium sp. BT-220-3]WKL23691.1 ABC transporter ATP-binding protein [Agrobacterium tumefaciens]